MVIETATVRANDRLARGIYKLELEAPQIAAAVRPGQCVDVLISESPVPLLRRPMSVASRRGDQIALIYKIFGVGTKTMAAWEPDVAVNLLGPLGNGWQLADGSYPILAGGGVGIAPISFLHDELLEQGIEHQLIMGARARAEHYLSHEPENAITLATDDGSLGIKGTVLDGIAAVRERLGRDRITIYGCGPTPMLAALQAFVRDHELACQLSMETIMGCGFGICQGCTVELTRPPDPPPHSYREHYQLACLDGPVFWAHDLA